MTRLPGESDAEFRKRIGSFQDRAAKKKLKTLLFKLGIKSARDLPGLSVNFAGATIRIPGVYTNVKV